jgi:hypothetical protein
MIAIGLACLLTVACATAELTLEQVRIQQYKLEEAEHLEQRLEVTYH